MTDLSGISKIYLFLSQRNDWVKEADSNGDGTIIKYEFSNFMKNNYDFNNVSENDQKELINKFWAKFDTNKSGKVSDNSKLRNKNALDSKEIDALNNKVEVFEALNKYVSGLVAPNCVDAAKWKSSVSESLANYVEEFVNQGKNANDLTAYLDSIKVLVSNKTTANLYAQDYAIEATEFLTREYGYNVSGDTQLQGVITNYVLSLNGTESVEDIIAGVKEAVDNYVATGNVGVVNSSNTYNVENNENNSEGNSETKVGDLNDIQKSIARTKIKEHAETLYNTTFDSLFGISSEDVKKEFKTALSSLIDSAIENFVNQMLQSDFNNLEEVIKSFNPADYVTDDMKTEVYSKYYSQRTDDTFDQLANELAKGVTAARANEISSELGIDLYNSNIGEFKLDAKIIRTLLKDLSSASQQFINTFIQSGKSPDKFDTEFKEFISQYLFEGSADTVNTVLADVTKDFFISDKELASYKETCINAVASVIALGNNLKLGSTKITSENYKEVIEAYTDGNVLMDDMQAMLGSIDTSVRINKYIEQSKVNIKNIDKSTIAAAAATLSGLGTKVVDGHLAEITAKNVNNKGELQSVMDTTFKLNSKGKIEFKVSGTTAVFNEIVKQTKSEIDKDASLKTAIQNIGGDEVIENLVQAAWICAYNSFGSSQRHLVGNFVSKVLENLDAMLNKLKTNPEYLNLYTMRTSYADPSLTDNLIHYNTADTYGADEVVHYKGGYSCDANGTVHLVHTTDDPDYQATMSNLLRRVVKKYSDYLDEKTITEIFRAAQKSAIDTCVCNTHDCPYGTGNNKCDRVEDAETHWGSNAGRNGDGSDIHMDQLVQLTLYYFDKLLYQRLAA